MEILHTVEVHATPAEVFRALAERGAARQFGDEKLVLKIQTIDVQGGVRLAWRCVDGPPGWVGTDISFDLATHGDDTVVRFAHRHWQEAAEDPMSRASAKWASFLFALKSWLEIPEAEDVYA